MLNAGPSDHIIAGIIRMTLVEQYRKPAGDLRAKANTAEIASRDPMSKWVIIGWIISFAGAILWLYGHFEIGSPPLGDWSFEPLWVARFFRNIESEAGTAVSITGVSLISWPHLR